MGVRDIVEYCRKHRTIRVAALYLPMAWAVLRGVLITHRALETPDWVPKFIAFILIVGYPIALIISWAMDVGDREAEQEASGASVLQLPAGTRLSSSQGMKPMTFGTIMVVGLLLLVVGLYVMYEPITNRVAEPTVAENSVAVLPFVNLSTDPENQIFGDGLSEELLNLLAGVEALDVAARTSSFALRDSKADIPTIGEQLRVQHVVEGSVRKSGAKIRVTAQLVRARDGYHVWSQNYDREFTDIFKIQDDIAKQIVAKLVVTLALKGETGLNVSAVTDPQAYFAYLNGRSLLLRMGIEDIRQALDFFADALEASPNYLPAQASRLFAGALLADVEGLASDIRQARLAEARSILEAHPGNVDAASAAAIHAMRLYRWEEARDALEFALGSHPNDAGLTLLYADLLLSVGDVEGALEELSRLPQPAQRNPRATYLRGLAEYRTAPRDMEALYALSEDAKRWTVPSAVDAQESSRERMKNCIQSVGRGAPAAAADDACRRIGDYFVVVLASQGHIQAAIDELGARVERNQADAKLLYLNEMQGLKEQGDYGRIIAAMGLDHRSELNPN